MGERGVDGVKGLAVRTVSRGKIEVMGPPALLVMTARELAVTVGQ